MFLRQQGRRLTCDLLLKLVPRSRFVDYILQHCPATSDVLNLGRSVLGRNICVDVLGIGLLEN